MVPSGRGDEVRIASVPSAIVMEKALAAMLPALSRTWISKVKFPRNDGVPEMTLSTRSIPAGRKPEMIDHV